MFECITCIPRDMSFVKKELKTSYLVSGQTSLEITAQHCHHLRWQGASTCLLEKTAWAGRSKPSQPHSKRGSRRHLYEPSQGAWPGILNSNISHPAWYDGICMCTCCNNRIIHWLFNSNKQPLSVQIPHENENQRSLKLAAWEIHTKVSVKPPAVMPWQQELTGRALAPKGCSLLRSVTAPSTTFSVCAVSFSPTPYIHQALIINWSTFHDICRASLSYLEQFRFC